MKKCFYPMVLAFLVVSVLIMGAATVWAYEGNCACAYCDRPCGSGHASNCPYASGGGGGDDGDDESSGDASFERAPIFVAPVGIVGGVFAGAVWYGKQMSGSLKEDFFIDSYQNFLSVKESDEWASGAFTFGLRMGGLPWLALYVPTGPIRYGVASAYKAATKPKPKPVDPNIAVYELIAKNYASLSKTNDEELKKAQGNVEAAMMRRTLMLDEHIAASAELRELREKEGIDAARARAQKQLDAWSKARAEKQKIAMSVRESIREKDAAIRDIINRANPIGFLADSGLGKAEDHLESVLQDKTLPQGARDSLARELKVTRLLSKGMTAYDLGSSVSEIADSYNRAAAQGKDASQWIEDRDAREKIWRLDLKLLSLPLTGAPGAAVGAAGTAMDAAYAATAGVLLSRRIDAEMATLDKLRTAQVFHDAVADDWDEVNIRARAARANEETIRLRGEQYKKMQKENESHAAMLRARNWKFK